MADGSYRYPVFSASEFVDITSASRDLRCARAEKARLGCTRMGGVLSGGRECVSSCASTTVGALWGKARQSRILGEFDFSLV